MDELWVYPATHYVTGRDRLMRAVGDIEVELADRLGTLDKEGKLLEAQRLRMRTSYDLEMMREVGFCSGIENYSRHLDGREAGERPYTLLDYFPDDYLTVIDESHVTIPQLHGQYAGDKSRKNVLIDHGFRLPSAADNRPLTFDEWFELTNQAVLCPPRPAKWEFEVSQQIVEQLIRPTGLVDPEVVMRPTKGQIDDLVGKVKQRAASDQRVLVTTLTKKMAEDLTRLSSRTRSQGSLPCTRTSIRSSAFRSSATCDSANTTCSSASTCCARGWTCRRSRWSRSSMPTKKDSCARQLA